MTDFREEWKPVVGYEKLYAVSNTGKVKNIKRNRLVRPRLHNRGYLRVNLSYQDGSSPKDAYIHRLVLAAFLGRPSEGIEVNHIDGIKSNNHITNLEYSTRSENVTHASLNGLMPHGSGHKNSKLNENIVTKIREEIKITNAHRLSKKYNVSPTTIRRILKRITWKHIP